MVCSEALALPYDNGDFANLLEFKRLITEIHAPHALARALQQESFPLGSEYPAHQHADAQVSALDSSGCRLLQVHQRHVLYLSRHVWCFLVISSPNALE
jgi:mannose/cellobiose epimerase-like protein (N-acyl-D-glucosamine 2-epimerase family)